MRRISGPRLRRARAQKYMNIAAAMRSTATGTMASPAIDAAERPRLSCAGTAVSDIVAGMVGCVSDAIVNCCDVEMVACCMRIIGKGDDDGIEGEDSGAVGGSCGCWPRATIVAVYDADGPSICTACSIGLIVPRKSSQAARHLSTGAPPTYKTTIDERPLRPIEIDTGSNKLLESFWNSLYKDALSRLARG